MCKSCYRLTDHYSWDNRWELAEYVRSNPIDLYNSKNIQQHARTLRASKV